VLLLSLPRNTIDRNMYAIIAHIGIRYSEQNARMGGQARKEELFRSHVGK